MEYTFNGSKTETQAKSQRHYAYTRRPKKRKEIQVILKNKKP